MNDVSLTEIEILIGGIVGSVRRTSSIKHGLVGNPPLEAENGFKYDISGALGEMAFCKAMGIYWSAGVNTYKLADASHNIQIRTSAAPNCSLIVRSNDKDSDLFVLVYGCDAKYQVIGWISGKDAKQSKYLSATGGRRAAYFVPRSALASINTIPLEESVRNFA